MSVEKNRSQLIELIRGRRSRINSANMQREFFRKVLSTTEKFLAAHQELWNAQRSREGVRKGRGSTDWSIKVGISVGLMRRKRTQEM